eukprot:c9182_g1_i2.p1 GENE.c9182_g1_i2~~c9182_g1_i2.p1  ORF type:complete len:133 (+),score=44.59 c9182_g1_i2:612-1010(+)
MKADSQNMEISLHTLHEQLAVMNQRRRELEEQLELMQQLHSMAKQRGGYVDVEDAVFKITHNNKSSEKVDSDDESDSLLDEKISLPEHMDFLIDEDERDEDEEEGDDGGEAGDEADTNFFTVQHVHTSGKHD